MMLEQYGWYERANQLRKCTASGQKQLQRNQAEPNKQKNKKNRKGFSYSEAECDGKLVTSQWTLTWFNLYVSIINESFQRNYSSQNGQKEAVLSVHTGSSNDSKDQAAKSELGSRTCVVVKQRWCWRVVLPLSCRSTPVQWWSWNTTPTLIGMILKLVSPLQDADETLGRNRLPPCSCIWFLGQAPVIISATSVGSFLFTLVHGSLD